MHMMLDEPDTGFNDKLLQQRSDEKDDKQTHNINSNHILFSLCFRYSWRFRKSRIRKKDARAKSNPMINHVSGDITIPIVYVFPPSLFFR